MFSIIDAMNAIYSGSADTVLVSASMMRLPWASRSAANDPFRRRVPSSTPTMPENVSMAVGYTAWASRYLYEYGVTREGFGRIAVNGRDQRGEESPGRDHRADHARRLLRGAHDP